MITHVGGLNAVVETTLNLPKIPGGKKLIYTNINMELTAIDDFAKKGETDPDVQEARRNLQQTITISGAERQKRICSNTRRRSKEQTESDPRNSRVAV